MPWRGPFRLPRLAGALVLGLAAFTLGCGGDGGGLIGPGSQDQDSDGVLDVDDRCPSQAETTNNWKDEDGCPDTSEQLYQFARTDVEEYWQRAFAAAGGSYVRIQVFQGYDGPIDTPCGPSIPGNATYCSLNHAIYYHIPLLDEFLEIGPYAPHFVIAHEFGHAVQSQLEILSQPYPRILIELQADCLAGGYTRDAKARGIVGQEDVEAAVVGLFRIGDPLDFPWFDPRAHGSAGERIDAFNRGVQEGVDACTLPSLPPPPPPGAAATTTTITADSPDPSEAGQAVTVTVRVTSAGGTPTGSVTLNVLGGAESCSGILSDGSVTCTLVLTREGTGTLIASYAGNSSFAPSSDTEAHTVQALPSRIEKVSGDGQTGMSSSELTNPLVVRVLDAQNNPVSARTVTWVVQAGGGTVSPQNSTTDAQGQASTRWTLESIGPNTVNAVVAGVGTVTFTATATAGGPSASRSTISVDDESIPVGATTTITVRIRDASGNAVEGVSVSASSSGTGNEITPASATSGEDGVATFSFRSTVAENKTITVVAGGVTLDDKRVITVFKLETTTEITDVQPEPSTAGQEITVTFRVTGEGGGTPTGTVTIFSLHEADVGCTVPVGQGSCVFTLNEATTHRLGATYSGDSQFEDSADPDGRDHVVLPAPSENTAPTALPDQYATPGGGQALTVPAPGVLANDSDPDGDDLSAQNASDPPQGSVSLNSDGMFTYTPDVGASGTDSFTYEASDGSLTTPATVTINIAP